ncbi:AAA-like domain-containing protein [Sorangium sp. So ce341]|uniref:AAA-like domain-containing protein n=1 Tax=Sorangium sp. So ce341 TaxID=3133302 RepID=UPI003F5D5AF2
MTTPPGDESVLHRPGAEESAALAPVRFKGRGMLLEQELYIERQADRELLGALRSRQHCHVLAPRQVGKSNLRVRATALLRSAGVRCVSLDLTGIASRSDEEAWYSSLIRRLTSALALPIDVDAFRTRAQGRPSERMIEFLHGEVLPRVSEPLVIFIDEIDLTLDLPFRDDFFRALLFMQDARADDAAWQRLTFCLLGVASPIDLVSDLVATPFNKSQPIELRDFTREELRRLRDGLLSIGGDTDALIDAIFAWTGGHPAFTQQICERLVLQGLDGRTEVERVADLADEMYLRRGRGVDPILADIDRRFSGADRETPQSSRLLKSYKDLLQGAQIRTDEANHLHFGLLIAGLVAERDGFFTPRNKIIATVFDEAWADEQLEQRVRSVIGWAQGREVTTEELKFLLAGREAAKKQEEERIQAELARERALSDVRQTRARYRWLQALVFVVVAFLSVLVLLFREEAADHEKVRQEAQRLREEAAAAQKQAKEEARKAREDAAQRRSEAERAQREAGDAAAKAKEAAEEAKTALAKAKAAGLSAADAKQKQRDAELLASVASFLEANASAKRQEAERATAEADLARLKADQAAAEAIERATRAENARKLADEIAANAKRDAEAALAAAKRSADEAAEAKRQAQLAQQEAAQAKLDKEAAEKARDKALDEVGAMSSAKQLKAEADGARAEAAEARRALESCRRQCPP